MDKIDQMLEELIQNGTRDETGGMGAVRTDTVLNKARELRDKLLLFKKTDPFHNAGGRQTAEHSDDRRYSPGRSKDIDCIINELIDNEETIKQDGRRAKRALSIAKEAQAIRDRLYGLKYKSANRYVDGSYYTSTLNRYKSERITQVLDDLIKSERQIKKDKKRLILAESIAKEAENVNEKARLLKKFEHHLAYYEKIINESRHLMTSAENVSNFYKALNENQEAVRHFNKLIDGMVKTKVKAFKQKMTIAFILCFFLMGGALFTIFQYVEPKGDVSVLKNDIDYMTSEFEKTMEKAVKLHEDLNILIDQKKPSK